MAKIERKRSTRNGRNKNIVQADTVGNTRVPSSVLDVLVHPDATPLHKIPQSDEEVVLSKVENLLGKGRYGAAIRDAKALKISGSPLAAQYEFLLQEKISRAYIGIADRYFIRGDKESAKKFFAQAIKPDTRNELILRVASLAERTFEKLLTQRQEILNGLVSDIKDNQFVDWCEKKNSLLTGTVIDTDTIREAISPDFSMEDVLGDIPSISPSPGWVDPLPPETEFIDFTSVIPASVFKADTPKSVDVDVSITSSQDGDNRIRTSVAMPIISNILIAKARFFAIDRKVTSTGQAQGLVPIFRYEYLRDKAKEIIAHIKDIDSRMLPIQFKLDDFAELVETIRRPLLEQKAELEAVNQKISELTQTYTALAQLEKEMAEVVLLLRGAQGECDCDWFCWVVGVVAITFVWATLLTAAVGIGLALGGIGVAAGAAVATWVGLVLTEVIVNQMTCDNIGTVGEQASTVHKGIRQAIQENEAELNYQLSVRDVLLANIISLSYQLSNINGSNQARLLNANTLNSIQAQYNTLRQTLLNRAQVMAKLTEEAFNFERDSKVHVIKSAYYDEDKKGYTAAETLLRDLEGLDYIDITGRTRKKTMQLSHVVSLRKNYPMSFPSIPVAGRARFMTTMNDFDRWFPGTYMVQIREVRVEVLVEDKPVPARGYISNDGVSFVRFSDTGNKIPVDFVDVFQEPDLDLAKLCFKRAQRRRHIDTMAFPDFESYLHEERMRKVQDKERNYFENIGPESTWLIEILPDQPFNFSQITDVRVFFQYEAFFDENLKNILQAKRYTDRRESSSFSIKKLVESNARVADFSDTVRINVSRALFEAPIIDKKILNVGFVVLPKGGTPLNGVARLEVSFQDAAPIQVETNNEGIVATASDHPTGTGLAELDALINDKNVDGKWTVKIVQLPSGIDSDDIEDIFLLLNYEYSP
jgi:hypothetical protein